jgi:hypothetical protein
VSIHLIALEVALIGVAVEKFRRSKSIQLAVFEDAFQ